MSRVLSNNVAVAYGIQPSLGVAPTTWEQVEPNTITAYGRTTVTKARAPISRARRKKKGAVIDQDSTAEFEADFTMDAFDDFIEGFMFAEAANVEFDLTDVKLKGSALDVTATGYALGAALSTFTNGTLLAGKAQWISLGIVSLFYAKGYSVTGNNGLKALNADLAAASTEVLISGLAVETAPANASLRLAGLRADDITVTIDSPVAGQATIVSAADIDWTTTGLQVGQQAHLGSDDGTGAVQNAMQDTVANDTFGYCRIRIITATTLTVDKLDVNLGAGGSPYTPTTLDVMFGTFIRDLETSDNTDDQRYIERLYQFEASLPDLGGSGSDEFEYSIDNFANELTVNMPLSDFMGLTFGFVGTDTEDIVVAGSRKAGASAALAPLRTTAVGTSSDIATLSTDLISAVGDVCFKSGSAVIANGVTPEKCLASLGAINLNVSAFEVTFEHQMLFTNKSIQSAINTNLSVTYSAILKNQDGAVAIDMPSMTLSGGDREYPVGQTVTVNLTGEAHEDEFFGYALGVSTFASVPTVRP